MKDINEYKKLASEAVDGAWICHETTIRNETIPSLANAVIELCQRVEGSVGAMPLELVDRSKEIIKKIYENKIKSQQATIDKLVKALELAEKELFRFNCDAPIYLTGAKEPVYLQVRQFLAEVRGEK